MASLVCRIELYKEKGKGIIVTVENEEDTITQTIVMDGTSIITTCKGSEETSTITQKQDSIAIKCKTFTLDAETITCKSTEDTVHESAKKINITSTEKMTVESKDAMDVIVSSDYKNTAANVTIEAEQDLKGSGSGVEFTGSSTGVYKGGGMTLDGSSSAGELSAPSVTVSSDGTLDVTGNMVTVDGQMVTVSGSSIQIG